MMEYILLRVSNTEGVIVSMIKDRFKYTYVLFPRAPKKRITRKTVYEIYARHKELERKRIKIEDPNLTPPDYVLFIEHFGTEVEAILYLDNCLERRVEEVYRYTIR